ncbi:alpha-ribazole phosphatase [Parabacteroides bouchesdurhonensis]|uniref:alpha-ribazole phosphatase n=1 Tax=Parabacteroides bouchesdurhonensis TaxID=1936995 RepID=UPI000E548CCD|nr:alpha-ribazole phosphatase [Parabacteroides bouchesdurhonensis]RHJ91173.1 alpha-ribazole phosphatase [Bacteroides sp. AM07-16]
MEIYFIRHTSVDVPAGYAYGQTDVPLRSTFQAEAEIVKNSLQNISFDKVWCSPLSRCVKLADYCGYPDAERDERVKELNFGEWEMKSWEDISTDPRSQSWFNDWLNVRIPSGESFKDQYIRVSAFIEELKESGLERVCVFAHGGVLTCARVYAGEYDITDAFKNIPSYGEIIKLTF